MFRNVKFCIGLVIALAVILCGTLFMGARARLFSEPVRMDVPAVTEAPTEAPSEEATEPPTEAPEDPGTYTLTFGGNTTLGSSGAVYYARYGFVMTMDQNYDYPLANVRSLLEGDDFTMLSMEGALCDPGLPFRQENFAYRGPLEFAQILSGSGVEAVSLANDHSHDYGERGYESTLAGLEFQEIAYVEDAGTLLYTTDSGLTIGVVGIAFPDLTLNGLKDAVKTLREQGAEIIVWSVHWGQENAAAPTQVQTQQAHAAIDAGVDIVFGSNPHRVQKVEYYGDGVILYSLGHFVFGADIYPDDLDGALVQVTVKRQGDGTVKVDTLNAVPLCLTSELFDDGRINFQPTPYEQGSEGYNRVMDKLGLSE